MKMSKNYRAALEKIGESTYAPLEAFSLVKEVSTASSTRPLRLTSVWASTPVRLISSCVVP